MASRLISWVTLWFTLVFRFATTIAPIAVLWRTTGWATAR